MAANAARAVDALVAARNVLLQQGWAKGTLENRNSEVCAAGALKLAIMGDSHKLFILRDLLGWDYLNRAAGNLGIPLDAPIRASFPITKFNDAPSTTFNDVMAVYDEAILLAKEAELAAPRGEGEPTT